MRKPLLLLALLLPSLWFTGSWAVQQRAIGSGSNWTIPVEGTDPRDLLRGHYIRFRYAWEVRGGDAPCSSDACSLCLSHGAGGQGGVAPIIATIIPEGEQCRHRVNVQASDIMVHRGFGRQPQFFSRIFVSESAAPQMEQMLQAGGVVVETSLTADGRLVNRRLIKAP